MPGAQIVAVSSAPPARETTPLPAPSTRTRGYDPATLPHLECAPRTGGDRTPSKVPSSQVRSTFHAWINPRPGWVNGAGQRAWTEWTFDRPERSDQGPSHAHLLQGLDISRSVRQT
jgi:hypothetical protein